MFCSVQIPVEVRFLTHSLVFIHGLGDFHWIFSDLECLSNMKWQHSGPDPDSERLRPKYATGSSRDPGDGFRTLFMASITIIDHQKRHGASIIAFCLSNRAGIQPVRDTLQNVKHQKIIYFLRKPLCKTFV